MTNGGPGYSTTVPILHMYKQATQFGQFGYSMALSFLLFLVTFGVTGLSNLFRRGEQ